MENQYEQLIENDASYSLKSPFLKGEVAKDHVNRCLIARSKEMKAGYFNSSLSNSGEEIREYINDTRKVFISSVKALYSLLYPEIQDEEDIKESLKNLDKKEEELFDKFAYEDVEIKNRKLEKTGVKYMPEYDELIKHEGLSREGVKVIKTTKGAWNKRVSYYWEELVKLYDERFNILNQLVHNMDYFSPEAAGY